MPSAAAASAAAAMGRELGGADLGELRRGACRVRGSGSGGRAPGRAAADVLSTARWIEEVVRAAVVGLARVTQRIRGPKDPELWVRRGGAAGIAIWAT